MNRLASELNKVIDNYAGIMKSRDFYHDVLGKLRKEPSNNRFLLLYPLKGLQVNPRYPFPHTCKAQLRRSKNKIIVDLALDGVPEKKFGADSYYYEVVVLQWTKSEKPCIHSSQLSDWIAFGPDGLPRRKKEPSFEFRFPSGPSVIHWLLCLRLQLCEKEKDIPNMPCQGMILLDVGSFNKKENDLLEKRTKEKRKEGRIKKVADERVRVKAKDG